MLTKLSIVFSRIEDILAVVGALIIISALLAVSADVLSRFFLNRPIGWVFEVTEFAMLYVPMLGAAYLLRTNGHVNIDIVLDHSSSRMKSLLNMITSVLGAIICMVVAYWGVVTSWNNYQRGVLTSGIVVIPKYILLGIIPIGFSSLMIEFVRKAYVHWEQRKTLQKSEA